MKFSRDLRKNEKEDKMEGLKIGDTDYQSRLLIGTAGYP